MNAVKKMDVPGLKPGNDPLKTRASERFPVSDAKDALHPQLGANQKSLVQVQVGPFFSLPLLLKPHANKVYIALRRIKPPVLP